MGTTPKPLRILVHPDIAEWSEFAALAAQGHTITLWTPGSVLVTDYDLILGPRAWRMTEDLRPFLPLAIHAARKARYPKDATLEETGTDEKETRDA